MKKNRFMGLMVDEKLFRDLSELANAQGRTVSGMARFFLSEGVNAGERTHPIFLPKGVNAHHERKAKVA